MLRTIPLALISTLLLLGAGGALASDGVIELSQTCAEQTGCVPGDTPGFPIRITDGTAPRSFRLTSDLVVPSGNVTAIEVRVPDATIDLAGFSILRTDCQGATSSCLLSNGGSGYGIFQPSSSGSEGLTVLNGSIVGMGSDGILARDQASVRNVKARWNGRDGLSLNANAVVEGSQAYENGERGIDVGANATLLRNVTFDNGGDGLYAAFAATLEGNSSYLNEGDGIEVGGGCTLRGNIAQSNGGNGILSSQGSVIVENTTNSNGLSGIRTSFGLHRVDGNVAAFNDDYGLRLSSSDMYQNNRVASNAPGAVLSGTNRGDNYCSGSGVSSAFCP